MIRQDNDKHTMSMEKHVKNRWYECITVKPRYKNTDKMQKYIQYNEIKFEFENLVDCECRDVEFWEFP